MKILSWYSWLAGTKNDFLRQFQDNETLHQQAKSFIDALDKGSWVPFCLMLVVGLLAAALYYTWYNNRPGRHYRLRYWSLFWLFAAVLAFLVTLGAEWLIASPRLKGAVEFEVWVAFANALYGGLCYLFMSIVWCQWLPTNAYRIFKKGRKQ